MHMTAIVYFVVFSALSALYTSVAVKNRSAKEMNPAMRFLLKSPPLFWVAQLALGGIVIWGIVGLGPWFSFLAVSSRAILAYNDYLVFRKKL
jgi:H+/Cl- antiporter ClcA